MESRSDGPGGDRRRGRVDGASREPRRRREKATRSWLALVDQGKYVESWDQAAPLFKQALTRDKWKEAVAPVRDPLGKVVSRTLKSREYTEALPNAPKGRYVVIQYATEFENKKGAVETVMPMEDPAGVWRVAGYFVR